MTHATRISIWPFVCLAGCLLVLTLFAPRAWRAISTPRGPRAAPTVGPQTTGFIANRSELAPGEPAVDTAFEPPPLAEFLPAPRTAEVCPPVAASLDSAPPRIDLLAPRAEFANEPYGEAEGEWLAPVIDAPPPADESPAFDREAPSFVPARGGCWPYPEALVKALRELSREVETRDWSLTTLEELEAMGRILSLAAPESRQRLTELARQVEAADALDEQLAAFESRGRLRRTVYALIKRLQVWDAIHHIAAAGEPHRKTEHDDALMRHSLAAVEELVRPLHDARAWREFLLLDEAWRLCEGQPTETRREELAAALLARLGSPQLTDPQQAFLRAPAVQGWHLQLRHWISQPIDFAELLATLERHELGDDGRDVARLTRMLLWSPHDDLAELGELIDAHWRNANVRVAISGELLNRLLPEPPPASLEPVRDRIRGAWVHGWGESRTEGLFVRLLPDRSRLRLGLEARGMIASETAAASGPVRVFNEGLARFRVRKLFLVDGRGVRTFQAEGEADSDNVLTGLETEYDGYPLVGALVRSIAMQQAELESGEAKWEVDAKLAAKVSRRLDESVQQKLIETERNFQHKVLLPLRRMDLDPEPLEMQTTAERLIVRYRLAGDDQLGAHTPRPQAPGNSLVSIQVHESGVNNVLEKLNLAGRRAELEELFRDLAGLLGRKDAAIPEDLPEGITVEFARRDPVQVEFVDGQVQLTLRFAEISAQGGGRWTDFSVRGNYLAEVAGLDARLVRDGIIYLETLKEDRPLTLGERMALQAIFSKALSKRHKFPLVPPAVQTDKRLADLRVSQLVIDGGWLGAALAPQPIRTQLDDAAQNQAPPEASKGVIGTSQSTPFEDSGRATQRR
jgi:hypothetical protein